LIKLDDDDDDDDDLYSISSVFVLNIINRESVDQQLTVLTNRLYIYF